MSQDKLKWASSQVWDGSEADLQSLLAGWCRDAPDFTEYDEAEETKKAREDVSRSPHQWMPTPVTLIQFPMPSSETKKTRKKSWQACLAGSSIQQRVVREEPNVSINARLVGALW